MKNKEATERKIGRFFNRESGRYSQRHENNGIPSTMQFHIQSLSDKDLTTVLDVGSGPGSLLIELAKKSDAKLLGIDLSQEMVKVANQRAENEGLSKRISFSHGSFLDLNLIEEINALSFHRVLCCHPNREKMLEVGYNLHPKIMTITIPRDWKLIRLLVRFFGLFAKLFGTFWLYIHTQDSVDEQMNDFGYLIKDRLVERFWVTTTYELRE